MSQLKLLLKNKYNKKISNEINYSQIDTKKISDEINYSQIDKIRNIFKLLNTNVVPIKNNKIFSELNFDKYICHIKQLTIKNKNNPEFINYENVSDIKIVLSICIYERYELTLIVLKYLEKLNFHKIIIVYSEEEDYLNLNLFHHNNKFHFIKHPNFPLSKKWNTAIKTSKQYNPHGVMILGSDDIITPEYLYNCKVYLKNDYDYISNTKWISINFEENIISFLRYIRRPTLDGIGAGRVVGKNILEKMNYNLYNFESNIFLDGSSFEKYKKYINKVAYDININSVLSINLYSIRKGLTVSMNNYNNFIKKNYRSHINNITIDNIYEYII